MSSIDLDQGETMAFKLSEGPFKGLKVCGEKTRATVTVMKVGNKSWDINVPAYRKICLVSKLCGRCLKCTKHSHCTCSSERESQMCGDMYPMLSNGLCRQRAGHTQRIH